MSINFLRKPTALLTIITIVLAMLLLLMSFKIEVQPTTVSQLCCQTWYPIQNGVVNYNLHIKYQNNGVYSLIYFDTPNRGDTLNCRWTIDETGKIIIRSQEYDKILYLLDINDANLSVLTDDQDTIQYTAIR